MHNLHPPASLRHKVNPEGSKSAGPLLHGWARRTSRGMVASPRHARALATYMPVAPAHVFESLGGDETLAWATKAVEDVGLDDSPQTSNSANEIIVLGLPYGGPKAGRDNDGQFFSPMTDFFDGYDRQTPVYYTHGTQHGFEPEPIGEVKARWYDRQGGWFKVTLDTQNPRYSQMIEANAAGMLRASSGAVPASYSTDPSNGHIDTWLVGELSLVDLRSGYQPINAYAITKAEVAEPTLFTDYYGDGVYMDPVQAMLDALNNVIAMLRVHKRADETEENIEQTGFVDPLFKSEETMADTEKCESCEQARIAAEALKAELAAGTVAPVDKCAKCPEAVDWVRSMVKAGKMAPAEAFTHLDTFVSSDETFEGLKAEVENRAPLGVSKAMVKELVIAGGTGGNPEFTIDPEHMNKQRRLVGLASK